MSRGKVKILCDSVGCMYCSTDDKGERYCNFKPCLKNQMCTNFKPSIVHYVVQFLNALGNNNMLYPQAMEEEVKIGVYYAMKIYNLGMVKNSHGDWVWYNFFCNDDPKEKYLHGDEIVELPANLEIINDLSSKLAQGLLPPFEDEKKVMEEETKKEEEKLKPYEVKEEDLKWYGFVDRTGKWYPVPFAEHENESRKIIKLKNWKEEFHKSFYDDSGIDFLIKVKGWVLIHNPYGNGTPSVNTSPNHTLTKAQKEFLYVYFMEHKEISLAEQYLEAM